MGPQIRHVMRDKRFEELLVGPEHIAWKAFRSVVDNFRAILKCQTALKSYGCTILRAYQKVKCSSHPRLISFGFSMILGDGSDEQGERFNRGIRPM